MYAVQCQADFGKGPHVFYLPAAMLWSLSDLQRFRCPPLMISLRDHGLMDRAELQVTGDYTQQRLTAMYTAITGAVVTGGVAAVEAVAGRVSRLMETLTCRVAPGPCRRSRRRCWR